MAFCKNCGAQVSDDAHFCKSCGASRTPNAEQAAPQPVPQPAPQPVYNYSAPVTPPQKKSNAPIFVLLGALLIAVAVLCVLLFLGGDDEPAGGNAGNAGTTPPSIETPVTPDVPDHSVDAENAEAALEGFLNACCADDPVTMLGSFWELSDLSSSEVAAYVANDKSESGYESEAEQCGDWLDLFLKKYIIREEYRDLWVYDGVDSIEIQSFTMDDSAIVDGQAVPVVAELRIYSFNDAPLNVTAHFSMIRSGSDWYIVYNDFARAAEITCRNTLFSHIENGVDGYLYHYLIGLYSFGGPENYSELIESEMLRLYSAYGYTPEEAEAMDTIPQITRSLFHDFLLTYGDSGIVEVLNSGDFSLLYDENEILTFTLDEVSFDTDITSYPDDVEFDCTCTAEITLTKQTDEGSMSYNFIITVPFHHDSYGYYYINDTI